MLSHARRRAPEARFIEADLKSFAADEKFDRALLANFLHENVSAERVAILRNAARALKPDGLLVVADVGPGKKGGRVFRTFVRSFEPPSVLDVMDGALESEIREAGFEIVRDELLARARVRAFVAKLAG